MAGHYGDHRSTMQNLEVVAVDAQTGIIAVMGAVPGAKEGYVLISDAVKKALPSNAPYPAAIKGGAKGQKPEATADNAPAAEPQSEESKEESSNES